MGIRSRVRNFVKPVVFACTPIVGGLVLLPLRLLDRIWPVNPLTLGAARLIDRMYPKWFHLRNMQAQDRTGKGYLAQRRESAETNARRYGVPLTADRFLEVGCGTGAKLTAYAEMTGAVLAVGCDVDLKSLRFGVTHGVLTPPPKVSLVLTPPYVLPVRDGSFDFVLCEEVLEHVDEPERLLAEIRRVLAPGGRAALLIGPLYLHAKGPHLQSHLNVMWPHVLFSHTTLERLLRSTREGEDLLSHDEVWNTFRTLNGHGERRYRRAIEECGLTVELYRRDSEYPVLAGLPGLGAFYRKNIRVVLRQSRP